jgi:RNA polymerase II-associated factor 1
MYLILGITRFVHYVPTSLERNYKHDYLTEADLGILIDLITPGLYNPPENTGLHPTDEALLEDEVVEQPKSKRAIQHAKRVSWLRKTEYIASEYNRTHATSEMAETTVGYSVKKKLQDFDTYKDRSSQIAAIEKSFEQAKLPVTKHYSKPGVVAEEVLPVYPDFELWKYPFAQVLFDSDPSNPGKSEGLQVKEMCESMIRGMVDENGEQFVAYFMPTQETIQKRDEDKKLEIPYRDGEEYEYVMAKDYNWTVKSKASKGYEESYFFVVRPGNGVFYNEIETRIRLNKRRQKSKSLSNTKFIVQHRQLTEDEQMTMDNRASLLEPPLIEEDYEEEEETEGTVDVDIDGSGEEMDVEGLDKSKKSTQDIDFETAFGGDDDSDEEGESEGGEGEGEGEHIDVEDSSGDDSSGEGDSSAGDDEDKEAPNDEDGDSREDESDSDSDDED